MDLGINPLPRAGKGWGVGNSQEVHTKNLGILRCEGVANEICFNDKMSKWVRFVNSVFELWILLEVGPCRRPTMRSVNWASFKKKVDGLM
jgi:hypothetical protein